MTRGTAFIITDNEVWRGCEFNGDMYRNEDGGHGDIFLKMLSEVEDISSFRTMTREFNKLFHKYEGDYVRIYEVTKQFPELVEKKINLNQDYWDRFFSDWIFIKNLSSEPITLLSFETEIEYELVVGESVGLNWGIVNSDMFSIKGEEKKPKKAKKRYIENIGELKGLNLDVQANLIADALLNGKRIEA